MLGKLRWLPFGGRFSFGLPQCEVCISAEIAFSVLCHTLEQMAYVKDPKLSDRNCRAIRCRVTRASLAKSKQWRLDPG